MSKIMIKDIIMNLIQKFILMLYFILFLKLNFYLE